MAAARDEETDLEGQEPVAPPKDSHIRGSLWSRMATRVIGALAYESQDGAENSEAADPQQRLTRSMALPEGSSNSSHVVTRMWNQDRGRLRNVFLDDGRWFFGSFDVMKTEIARCLLIFHNYHKKTLGTLVHTYSPSDADVEAFPWVMPSLNHTRSRYTWNPVRLDLHHHLIVMALTLVVSSNVVIDEERIKAYGRLCKNLCAAYFCPFSNESPEDNSYKIRSECNRAITNRNHNFTVIKDMIKEGSKMKIIKEALVYYNRSERDVEADESAVFMNFYIPDQREVDEFDWTVVVPTRKARHAADPDTHHAHHHGDSHEYVSFNFLDHFGILFSALRRYSTWCVIMDDERVTQIQVVMDVLIRNFGPPKVMQ